MQLETEDTKRMRRKRNNDVLKDGEVYRVPIMLLDGVSKVVAESLGAMDMNVDDNRPHFASQTDADRKRRQQLYVDAEQRLCDRWKHPTPLAADVVKPAASQPTGDAKQDAYDNYDRHISERWKHPAA